MSEQNKDMPVTEQQVDSAISEVVAEPAIPEKIALLLAPISQQAPTGEDPLYSDEFVLIKNELEKLSDNDYSAIVTLAEEILKTEGKDLRVAGYYLLASTYISGVDGFIQGLMLYRLLLENFYEDIHPLRPNSRQNTLQWLSNDKLFAFFKQAVDKASSKQISALMEQVELFNKTIISVTSEETLRLTAIYNVTKETAKRVVPETSPTEPTSVTHNTSPTSPVSSSSEVTRIQSNTKPALSQAAGDNLSDTELLSLMRKIVNQFNGKGDYLRGIAYARAVRWGGLSMPPNENGKTRMVSPRQAGMSQISSLLAQGDHDAAFRLCEGTFFEAAGHVRLDLQCYAHRAAKAMGQQDVANCIAYETAALLKRLPGLEQLRFDDDTPFANAETIAWLNSINPNQTAGAALMSDDGEDDDLQNIILQAQELANEQGLTQAIAQLDTYRAKTEKQRYQWRLAMAQLCLEQGRADLAHPMLEELMDQAERTSLPTWDTRLAMNVATQLQTAIRGVMANATEQNMTHYEQQLDAITAQMCRWDLALAAQVL